MKFWKDFKKYLDEALPGWRDNFLAYKSLKKLIKHLPRPPPPPPDHGHDEPPRLLGAAAAATLEALFVGALNVELEKFNVFFIEKEGEFVIRLQKLKERIEKIRLSKSGAFTSKSGFTEEMFEICKAFVTIHGEIVLLKNYSSLNFVGLVKILKKYDKRTGGLLRLPFTQRALHQPFFATDPLTCLVHECEANLELLFPLEAEVIESDQTEKGESQEKCNPQIALVRSDNIGVYRSILAAMETLQGLQKASSTHHDQDEDNGSGAVTTENPDSTSTSQNQEVDQESVHSDDQGSPSV